MPQTAPFCRVTSAGLLEGNASSNWIRRWLAWVTQLPKYSLLLRAFFLLAVGAWLDIATGLQLSIFAFYFVPIFITSFLVGPRSGIFMSLLSAGTRAVANHYWQTHDGSWVAPAWNFCVDSVSFLIFSFLLSSVREQLDKEVSLARRDPLTQAFNRRAFATEVENEIERLDRGGLPFTLAYLDLDNFKSLNDALGHNAGDELLVAIVNTMREKMRALDVIARMGGDEFAILMPQTLSPDAGRVLGRVCQQLKVLTEGGDCQVTISIGAVTYLRPPASFEAALASADQLLYDAKRAGKDCIHQETQGVVGEAVATAVNGTMRRPNIDLSASPLPVDPLKRVESASQ